MKKLCLIVLVLLCTLASHAQNEAAIWYFGQNAGLDFNGGAPIALNDGELNTAEGCATIADLNGNLLFYTDGITIWNRNHNPMLNGTGLNGHPSSTQSGIIVPFPGNPNLYYVFTVDERAESNGLQYNIVDLTLDGGNGEVTLKNQLLETPVTEKLTAVTHANGTDVWVLAHRFGSNDFVAYLVTAAGLNTTPIISSIGKAITNVSESGGYLKLSPDGSLIAAASTTISAVELFQFDATTGLVSNTIDLSPFFLTLKPGFFVNCYGVEFSSDSSKLYATVGIFGLGGFEEYELYQFDLTNYSYPSITGSSSALANQPIDMRALQLAIDGKIYVTQYNQTYLGAINNPNVLGVGADYVNNVISIAPGRSELGLPPFITSYFVVGLQARNFCLGDSTEFTVTTNGPVTSISWDFGDGNLSNVENPTHTYAAPGTYTVSVTATTVSETKTESKDIIIYEVPTANTVSDFEVCTRLSTHEFDLSTKNAEVLGAQLAIANTISYYSSLTDAQNGTNVLPQLYSNTNATETIYVRISNVNNPSCFDTTSFDLVLKEAPEFHTSVNWVVCDMDTDGFFDFDLTQKNTEVLNGQSATAFSVSYHETLPDAQGDVNALVGPYTNTSSLQTIFFRIENTTYPECFETGHFDVEVIPVVSANPVMSLEECDDNNDGYFVFDLTVQDTQILGTQNAADFNVSYHSSQADADAGSNRLNATNYENTTPDVQVIYARVENNRNTSCFNTTSFQLVVHPAPILQPVSDWLICDDDNDGIQTFDLTQKNVEILGTQPASSFTISYHESQTDADTNSNAISGLYQNTGNPQNIYYRIENIANPTCYLTNGFALEVFDTPTANTPSPFEVCDTNETGIQTFDLSQKDGEVLNGQSAGVFEVFYFANPSDADSNVNPLPKSTYSNTQLNETIFIRIQNRQNSECFATTTMNISVNPLPEPILEETYVICPDSPELTIDGGEFESWSWRDAQNNEISTDRILNVTALGEYTLTVGNSPSGLPCEKTVSFEVVSSGAPDDFTTEISNFSDVITVEVNATGIGDFEYSSDGENFQDSNRLEVFPGTHTIYVRDAFLCRTISKEIIALGFRKFFTPNGDGIHDYWNILGAENFPNSKIYIFDRQGKLLQQLSPENRGWDGTFQGVRMPSSDYWFRFINEDGKVHTGHFSLKR